MARDLPNILQRYAAGEYTVTDTVLAVLQLVSNENVDVVISSLPLEVRLDLREFVRYYHPGVGIFNGPRPSVEAVQLVKECLAKSEME
jgi:hypothetical protein